MSPTARSKSACARGGGVSARAGCAAVAGVLVVLGGGLCCGGGSGFAGGALGHATTSPAPSTSPAARHGLLESRDHILRELCLGVARGLELREHGVTLLHPLVIDAFLGV